MYVIYLCLVESCVGDSNVQPAIFVSSSAMTISLLISTTKNESAKTPYMFRISLLLASDRILAHLRSMPGSADILVL